MWWVFKVKWVVLWSLWLARLVRQPTVEVKVSGGWLRGSVVHSGTYAQYLAIPYASVSQRFQAPGPEPKWKGVFEAINENVRCKQSVALESSIILGQDNCQTINVYTPLKTPPDPYPVMVFIHGGGFYEGSANPFIYGPRYFMQKDVILVTFNYRLNVEGFLCLGIKEAPGNAAMKDQVAALKWVQRNIRAFGGDPDNVTLFGESAGAASVSFHLLSPMSKGLFHKAIMESGSSLASWVMQYEPVHAASLKAKLWDYHSEDPHDLYKFFISMSNSELVVKLVPKPEGNVAISQLIFLPCIEKPIDGEEAFLSDSPFELLVKGNYSKVPMIIGSNTEEGLFFVELEKAEYLPKIMFEVALLKNLEFPSKIERRRAAEEVKKVYMGDDDILDETRVKFSKFVGEPFFNYPGIEETELIINTNHEPVYHYMFGYTGNRNVAKFSKFWTVPGATHADELFYIFSQDIIPTLFEDEMVDRMTTMWSNFAKYGDPTPATSDLITIRWPRVSKNPSEQQAFYIDKELKTIPLWHKESLSFWKNLYSKYRRKR